MTPSDVSVWHCFYSSSSWNRVPKKSVYDFNALSHCAGLARFSHSGWCHANGCVLNQKESIMQFNIEDAKDIAKLLGTVRLMAKGEFKIAEELLDELLARLARVARERGIALRIVSPSGERIIEFTAYGIIAGAALGYYIGQFPGAVIGAVTGGLAGYSAAHMTLVMDRPGDGDHVLIKIA
jgi:hypothetical protein